MSQKWQSSLALVPVFSWVRITTFFGHIACPGLCQRESPGKTCHSHPANFLCISAQLFPSWPTSPISCWVVTESAAAGIPEVQESSSWHTLHFHPFLSVSPRDCTQPAQVQLRRKQHWSWTSQKTHILFLWTVCSQGISSVFPHLVQSPRQRKVSVLYQVGTLLIPSVAVKLLLGSSSLLYAQHSSGLHFAALEVCSAVCHPQSPPLLTSSHLSFLPYWEKSRTFLSCLLSFTILSSNDLHPGKWLKAVMFMKSETVWTFEMTWRKIRFYIQHPWEE